jgi:O-antigen ligase
MAMLGILGLVVWAGLIIGPVIALVASVIPSAPEAENKTG